MNDNKNNARKELVELVADLLISGLRDISTKQKKEESEMNMELLKKEKEKLEKMFLEYIEEFEKKFDVDVWSINYVKSKMIGNKLEINIKI